MRATIDFGNTRGKIVLFDNSGEIRHREVLTGDSEQLSIVCEKWAVKRAIASTVVPERIDWLREHTPEAVELHILSHQTPLPIKNGYSTPETLGMDRLAAVVGAWTLFPQQASLVVDLGTCTTYDLITPEGEYLGGAISPGMEMRGRAMNAFTAALPLASPYEEAPLVGGSTKGCLRSGVVHGLCFEIEGFRQAYRPRFEIFNTVLCGGNAQFFETKLKPPIFVSQELVSIGLNAILEHLYSISQPKKSR